jgi:hypothetical protein
MGYLWCFALLLGLVFTTQGFVSRFKEDTLCLKRFEESIGSLRKCGRFLAYKQNLKAAQVWFRSRGYPISPEQIRALDDHIKAVDPGCYPGERSLISLHKESPQGNLWPNWVFYIHLKEGTYGDRFLSFSRSSHAPISCSVSGLEGEPKGENSTAGRREPSPKA